jgi:hypothetical protein
MNEEDFEGTVVLEKLAEIGAVDAFFEAIDADDASRAAVLLRRARIDAATIAIVLKKMADPETN